jgi:hypothetical protein
VEAMARLLEAHVKQHFWNDQNDGSTQEVTVSPSELEIASHSSLS